MYERRVNVVFMFSATTHHCCVHRKIKCKFHDEELRNREVQVERAHHYLITV